MCAAVASEARLPFIARVAEPINAAAIHERLRRNKNELLGLEVRREALEHRNRVA